MSLSLLKQSMGILEDDMQSTKKAKTTANKKIVKQKTSTFIPKTLQKQNLQEIRHELNQGARKADENMRRLLALSQNTVKAADAKKIVKRAHKGRYLEIELPKVEQESIFTDEDFRAFEEEYFKSN